VRSEPDRDRIVERMLRQSLKPGAGAVPPGPCLEAETLAAWADGGLSVDALARAGEHVADCPRCQALLVAIIQSSPAPAVTAPWWRRGWMLGVAVPITAAAAALVLWIALPRNEPRPSIESAPAVARADAPSPPPALERREQAPAVAESKPGPVVAQRGKAQSRPDVSRDDAKKERAAAAPELDRMSSASAGRAMDAAPAPPATVPPPASPSGATANAIRPSRESVASFLVKAAPLEIVSPDRSTRWHPGAAGVVEYSGDGGATWQTLSTGVSADLIGGASPSAPVCWLVGRGGTVLLSTDGRRFAHVVFPETVDLVAVSALDARTATVTTADGRRFSTADGGLTWRQ